MQIKLSEELIAPCGMNCGVCKYRLAKEKGLYKSKKSGCIGCMPRNKGCTYQGGCKPINSRSVRFCYECADFPCKRLDKLNKRYSTKYHSNLIDNLLNIKKNGITMWLKDEEQRWKCANCGGEVSIHDLTCYDCGIKRSK